jgi:hypothetical protein
MNERILGEFRAHVERATRFLPLRRSHKIQVQEELLAHLLAVYAEEFTHLQDERAAAETARRRFGDADDLREDIRDSVPLWERLFFGLGCTKENVMWRLLLALGLVTVAVGLGFVFPAVAQLRGPGEVMTATVPLLILGIVLTLGGFGSLAYGVERFRTRNP